MTTPKDCAVLVPIARALEPATEQCLLALADAGYHVQTLRGSSQVDLARSTLATWAMRKGFKETLWIDADSDFALCQVERIRSLQLPFCAGLYMRKKSPTEFAAKFKPGTPSAFFGPRFQGGGPLEMEYVGMGFTYVRREVYESIERACQLPTCTGGYEGQTVVPYFLPMLVPNGSCLDYLSEDYSLCHRARQAGFRIVADTTLKIGHQDAAGKIWTWDDIAGQPTESLQLEFRKPELQEEIAMASEGQLYEKLGRLQDRFDALDAAYTDLLQRFAGVIKGDIARSRCMVNLTDRAWTISDPGTTPGTPAMINGKPECVCGVADEPPLPEPSEAYLKAKAEQDAKLAEAAA